ncbi:MAG TPA: hypothetical protein VN372_12485 [Methanospirillum sp.]|nr:hypothetical protein [Methanospirillum sp.]
MADAESQSSRETISLLYVDDEPLLLTITNYYMALRQFQWVRS